MNKLQKNVRELCLTIESALYPDGTLNVTQAAKVIGLSQPTLKRILDGVHDQARPATENKIADFFGIRPTDLYSDRIKSSCSDEDVKRAIDMIDSLPPEKQLEVFGSFPAAYRIVVERIK